MTEYAKIISLNEAREKNMRLDYFETVKFSEGCFLMPWTNVFHSSERKDQGGLGWHDSRIWYPEKDIQIFDDLYVIDTSMARTIEARALLQYRDLRKGNKKTPEEMMKYLSKKEPRAHFMCTGKGEKIYTPAFQDFIVSISPTHYLHFEETEKGEALEVAKGFHNLMKGILRGEDPNLINYLISSSTKN